MQSYKGFTLLELIIVVIILGILATFGYYQYGKTVEKGRTAEAKAITGQIRSAAIAYIQQWGAMPNDIPSLYVNVPQSCVNTHYFRYDCEAGYAIAMRCTASGKTPNTSILLYISGYK